VAFNPNDLWDPNYKGPIPGPRGEEADERWWDPRSWDAPATGTDGSSGGADRPGQGGGFNPGGFGMGSDEAWKGGSRYGGWGQLAREGIGGWGGAANKLFGAGLGIKTNFKDWQEKHPGENAFRGRMPDNTRPLSGANQVGPGSRFPGAGAFGDGEPMTFAEYLHAGMMGGNLNIY